MMEPLGSHEEAVRRISLYLRLPDRPEVHRSMAFTMLAACGEEAVPELVRFLSDGERDNRCYAACALSEFGKVRNPDVVGALIITMQEDSDSTTRWAAARSLGSIGDLRAAGPLIATLKDKQALMRQIAAAALGGINDPRAADPLAAALQDEDELTRTYAAASLGKLGDIRALEALKAALGDKRDWVRQEAVMALGKINDPRAIKMIEPMLNDPSNQVKHFAREALKKIRAGEKKNDAAKSR